MEQQVMQLLLSETCIKELCVLVYDKNHRLSTVQTIKIITFI